MTSLTAQGLGGVDLLTHEELLQLPDVHPGLGHGLRVAALRRAAVLGGVATWTGTREMIEGPKQTRVQNQNQNRTSAGMMSSLRHLMNMVRS